MLSSKNKKHFWLYVLQLREGKYYIGITSRKDPNSRIREHMNGFYSAQWVKKYKPQECIEKIDLGFATKEQAYKLENQRTLQYMKKYGHNNVRGGKFNYSGKYVRLTMLGIYIREEEFKNIISIVIMMIIIIWLGILAST